MTAKLEKQRKVLVKRGEIAKAQEAQRKLRVKIATARHELKQLRGAK